MARSERVRQEDVRAVLRILAECRERGADAVDWRLHLSEALRPLLGAHICTVGEARGTSANRMEEVVQLVGSGFDAESEASFRAYQENRIWCQDPILLRLAVAPGVCGAVAPERFGEGREWYRSVAFNEFYRVGNCHHAIISYHALPGGAGENTIGLYRPADAGRFGRRERLLLDLIHEEIGRMLGGALATARDAGLSGLSPRLRQTLDCLLNGDSEKQAALRLGIRTATLHEYVVALYRHFGVGSRGELLAFFLRRFRDGKVP
jgi:DNA-binding CsgD family transcriptional regulator